MVEVWCRGIELVVINYYNPCRRLELDKLLEVQGQDRCRVIWCGDFNSHNSLWGGGHTDINGQKVETLLDERELVCLNDGRGTRVDVHTGRESVLDLIDSLSEDLCARIIEAALESLPKRREDEEESSSMVDKPV